MVQQVLVVAIVNLRSQDHEGADHFLEGQGGACSRVGWCGQSILLHRCGAMYNEMESTGRSWLGRLCPLSHHPELREANSGRRRQADRLLCEL